MTRRLATMAALAARRLLADRAALVVSVAFYLVVTTVLASLWRAAAGDHGVVGYSGAALTWYIVTSEAAVCAISIRLIEEVGEDIASGDVAVEMLRPLPLLATRLAVDVGRSLARLVALLVPGALLAWAAVGPPPSAVAALLALPSLALAVTVNVVAQYAVAGAAFWLRDGRATWFLYQKVVFVAGGMLLPLEVLPDALHRVAAALPFMAMAYAPARLAAGYPEPGLLLVQAGWGLVLLAGAAAVFAAGQQRLQVVGG